MKGNKTVRAPGDLRVCTQLEGAGGGAQRGRRGGEFKAEFCVGLEDGFMIP